MDDNQWLYAEIGRRIREARGEVTQERLASECGLSRTSITNIEAGAQQPPIHVLWRIADSLNVPICSLLPESSPTPRRDTPLPDDVPSMTRAVLERISGKTTAAR